MIVTRRKLRKPSSGGQVVVVNQRYEGGPTSSSVTSSSAAMRGLEQPESYHNDGGKQEPPESAQSARIKRRAAAPSSTSCSSKKKTNMFSSRSSRKTASALQKPSSSGFAARPMVLLPLPTMLHLPGSGGKSSKQQKQRQQANDESRGRGEYDDNDDESSSDDSSYHSVEPPPQASQAVAQLIDDKIERQRATKEAQLERQALVRRELARGRQDHYDIRLLIYLHALRAEEVKKERKQKQKMKEAQQQAFNISSSHIDTHQAKVDLEQKLHFTEQTFAQAELKKNSIVKKKKSPEEEEEVVHFEKIGTVPPSLASMIAQAATELRPVPKQHKTEFKPICNDAAEIGKFLRLKEDVVEAQGTGERKLLEKQQAAAAADTTPAWTKGKASVTLPKFDNCRSEAFNIVNEAAALGKIVSLKPQVTRNYDPVLDYMGDDDEDDVDVLAVDDQGHKDFRIKYLTDVHVRHHRQDKKKDWDVENLDQTVHYDLDTVALPTGALPVYTKPRRQLSEMEIKEGIAQGVAEALWERQYRLERPEAELRMRPACSCRYCQTSNPYQTHAYRKKWLVRQGIWVEPPPLPEPRKKSRHDPLVDLRKRLKVEKAKEEQIRREAERQKWLAESKDLYSKTRLKSTPAKDAPVELDPEAEAVEQRKENLAVAQRRSSVTPKTAPVVAVGESVSTRMERFQNGVAAGGDESLSAAAEVGPTTWERDTKGRWVARTAGESSSTGTTTSSSAPAEWAHNTTTIGFRQAPAKSKKKPPPSFIPPPSSPSKRSFNSKKSFNSIAERVRAAISPKDVKLKPISKSSSPNNRKQTGQPAKKRKEFLKPFSPKNSKSNKSVASTNLPKGREVSAQLPQPPLAQSKTKKRVPPKSLKERLVEKRREILKLAPPPMTPSDVKLKPVDKKSLEDRLQEKRQDILKPDNKKNEFLNVRLKPATRSNVQVEDAQGPRILSQSQSMTTSTKPDVVSSEGGDSIAPTSVGVLGGAKVLGDWSTDGEVEDIFIYDDDDYEEEEIIEDIDDEYDYYEEEEIIEYIDEEDEFEDEILDESEYSEEEIVLDESEVWSESTEEAVEDSSSYDEDFIEEEIIDEPESALGGSFVRNLWNDIIDIIDEGDEFNEEEEEAANSEIEDQGDSMYFEESEAPEDSSVLEVSESDNEASYDSEPQEQLSTSAALETLEDISKESMTIGTGTSIDTALNNVRQESSNTGIDSARDESSNADSAQDIVQCHNSNADTAVDTPIYHDSKPERKRTRGFKDKKKGVFKQLGRTFGSFLGRKKKRTGAGLDSSHEANLDPFGSSPLAPSNADLTTPQESKSPSQAETSEGEKLSQHVEAQKGIASVVEPVVAPVQESNETPPTQMPILSTDADNSAASDHVADIGVEEETAERTVDTEQLDLIEEELELIEEELELIEEEGAMEDASPSKVQPLSRDGQPKSPNPQEGHELAGDLDSQPAETLASVLDNSVPDEDQKESTSGTDTPFDEDSVVTG